MRLKFFHLGVVFWGLLISPLSAATLYVDLNSTNPVAPYADWGNAATNIQDAIDAAGDGDLVLVTNGVYQTGGKIMFNGLTNRVALDKAVTVQSVNGPFATIIQGAGATNGPAAVRCAWLANNAALIGFTLRWGATQMSGDTSGGGVRCASSNAVVANCVIVSNTAYQYGGGAYQGTLENCLIESNNAFGLGGGTCNAILLNCTVINHLYGYGIYATAPNLSFATNCIIYFNGGPYTTSDVRNYSGPIVFSHCCTKPLPPGDGNFTNAPQFFVDGVHLASTSPCIGAGMTVATGTDIFGNAWADPPSVGCVEATDSLLVSSPQLHLTGAPVGFDVESSIAGRLPIAFQWLKDGVPLQDNGHFSFTQTTNLVATGIHFSDAGNYQLAISNAVGVVTSTVTPLVIHCVNVAGANPVSPYLNWATAATNIQDAITASAPGEIVLVTNGVYASGGKTMDGLSTNRVTLDKPLIVTSVNGFSVTAIQGAWDPFGISGIGPLAVRCAWLTNYAVLNGFTLRGGGTPHYSSSELVTWNIGGGAWCASSNAIVSNCVLTNNSAEFGGGIARGTLNNSLVVWNSSTGEGSGALGAVLNNCTVEYNLHGAGVYDSIVHNCILLNNFEANFDLGSGIWDSCTYPAYNNNIDGHLHDPQFLDLFHISTTSPCCGAGNAQYTSGTDLDGEPWVNPPSMGCDEVVESNIVGPLSVTILSGQTNVFVNWALFMDASITGRADRATWAFGDGAAINAGVGISHTWTNAGDYTITFTAYNNDHTNGVSTNLIIHVLLPEPPQLLSPVLRTNGFQFQFLIQSNVNYTFQYATNLSPPVVWQDLETISYNASGTNQIIFPAGTDDTRFYRMVAH